MKALFTVVCFLFSASAFAAIDFSEGQRIDQVKVDGKNSQFSGTVAIANAKVGELIKINMLAPFDCPAMKICPEVMQQVKLEAQIVNISQDCGSIVYHAITDDTPHDGLKTEIKVQDNSTRSCRDIRPGVIEIAASTKSGWTQTVHTYEALQTWKLDQKNFDLSQGVNMKTVKLGGGEVAGRSGFVKVNEKSGEVLVSYLYVDKDAPIRGAKFQHKTLKLTLTSKKADACGSTIYSAQTSEIRPGAAYTEVIIADNSNRICEDVYRAQLTLDGVTRFPYPGRESVTIEMLK